MARRKRAPVLDDLFRVRRVSDPQVSLDGKCVAWVQSEIDRTADLEQTAIWVAPLARGSGRAVASPRAFTSAGSCTSPRWSPDGRALAYVCNRGAGAQIHVGRLDGGEPRAVTSARASSTQPVWSPDGSRIAFVRSVGERHGSSKDPVERNAPLVVRDLHYRFDATGGFDARRRHVFTVDVETGEERQVTRGDWHDTQPAWSPDGRHIAFVSDRGRDRFDRMRGDVWLAPSGGGRPRRISAGRGGVSSPRFSPDGHWLAWVGHEHGDDYPGRNISLIAVRLGGGRAPVQLTARLDRSLPGYPLAPFGDIFAWLPDSKSLLFLAGERGAVLPHRVELTSGAVKKVLDEDLQITALSVSPSGREFAFASTWVSELPEIHAAPVRGGRRRAVSCANSELTNELALVAAQRVQCRSTDGLEVESFLLLPTDHRKGRRHPLELNVHGGPHGAHPLVFNPLHYQLTAAAGFAVLLPNPRGSTGYGESFERACVGDWGGGDYRDLMAAVDEVVRLGYGDPKRLFVSGYSYGGYMSAWIVTQTDRFRAAVIGAPLTNLASTIGTTDVPLYDLVEMGIAPWDDPAEYSRRSPVTHVGNAKTPSLLLHWEGDLRCPIAQSEELFVALKLCGVDTELVRYPRGSHAARTPSQDADCFRRGLEWYARNMPGRRRG